MIRFFAFLILCAACARRNTGQISTRMPQAGALNPAKSSGVPPFRDGKTMRSFFPAPSAMRLRSLP